ncbi:VWA domain-containing protein [Salegentibacter sp. F14]
MDLNNIILIALAAIIALGFSFFQYIFRRKKAHLDNYVLFGLRSLSVFILLLLLMDLKITTTTFELEKPNLILAADNSVSIAHLNQADTLRHLINSLENNQRLQERFDISNLSFGSDIQLSDSLSFQKDQTDIHNVLSRGQELFHRKNTAMVLFSDGHQTFGRDYPFFKSRSGYAVLPLVLGDTTSYADLEIRRLNVNRYAFLGNRFPVEIMINYKGQEPVSTSLELRLGTTVVYQQNLDLGPENASAIINTTLPANGIGVHTYQAMITPLARERNTENNKRNFAVEVIDERAKILLLSDLTHPDLGALKKSVEHNLNRELEIKYIGKDNYVLEDYQLVVLYQPNTQFRKVFEQLHSTAIGRLIITGTQTDWRFLNSHQELFNKDFTAQSQEFEALYNSDFTRFQFEDIGFEDFPPLMDHFGEIQPNGLDPLLYQKIANVETLQPLLAIAESKENKTGVLFGEGIWRWRAASWRSSGSFEDFDDFLGKIVQYLSTQRKRERLSIDYKSFYYSNERISLAARFFDENYAFDPEGSLHMRIENIQTGQEYQRGMLLKNNAYVLDLENLPEGNYEFTLREEHTGLTQKGKFSIVASSVETQLSSANLDKLQFLATNNNENLYFPDNLQALISQLLNDERFIPVQKSNQKNVPLVNWYYLLFLLVALLAAEWFFRKYRGLI